ncbi:MAG: universal stress protein [Acidovorax sp.]
MYTHILIATDGSDLSEKAVQHGLELARLCGARVTALKIAPRYPSNYYEGAMTQAPDTIRSIESDWRAESQKVADKVAARGAALQVPVAALAEQSDFVGETIIEVIEREHCDLVVMASHGYRGLKRLLLGSETQHVLTHAQIPVLVLR